MKIHFEKTTECRLAPDTSVPDVSPARLALCLVQSLRNWFGTPSRRMMDGTQLQYGYEVLTVPVQEFSEIFGPLVQKIHQAWPIQIFGLGGQTELVELSFPRDEAGTMIRQYSISGHYYEQLRDLYLRIRFPDEQAAECMSKLLDAAEKESDAAALEWKYADFLDQQKLAEIDRTLSFCYVSFEEVESRPSVYLSALTPQQKCQLWRLYLEKGLLPPEFEWLRDALTQGDVPDWLEWQLALYSVLEKLGIRFLCQNGQFELLDQQDKRLYFSVDHGDAAAQALMKVLFPLNR